MAVYTPTDVADRTDELRTYGLNHSQMLGGCQFFQFVQVVERDSFLEENAYFNSKVDGSGRWASQRLSDVLNNI